MHTYMYKLFIFLYPTVFPPSSPLGLVLCLSSLPAFHNPFLFRKWHVPHEYQQIMANQVSVRLSTSPYIEAGQCGPVWRVGSQKSGK